jgi:hypothetical protein
LYTLVEPHRGHQVEYNRWYERDHFYAGCQIGAYNFAGARFVSTAPLKELRYPKPGTDLAAGVEVVTLVPAVVLHLVAPVGLDQGVQEGADPDGIVGHPAFGGCRSSSHEARAPFAG